MTPPPYAVPVACAQACLNATVGICPRALVIKLGGLTPGERCFWVPGAVILAQLWEASLLSRMPGSWTQLKMRGQGERCVCGGNASVVYMAGRWAALSILNWMIWKDLFVGTGV